MFVVTVQHDGLRKHRVITGSDRFIVEEKARAQIAAWEVIWKQKSAEEKARQLKAAERQQAVAERRQAMAERKQLKQQRLNEAQELSNQAQAALASIEGILASTLAFDDKVNWQSLKRLEPFDEAVPVLAKINPPILMAPAAEPARGDTEFNLAPPHPVGLKDLPRKPFYTDPEFAPSLGLLRGALLTSKAKEAMARAACSEAVVRWQQECKEIEAYNFRLMARQRASHQAAMQAKFEQAHQAWQKQAAAIETENRQLLLAHKLEVQKAQQFWKQQLLEYESRKATYAQACQEHNEQVDAHKAAYERHEPGAVYDYFDLVLSASRYPEFFPREWEMEYLPDSRMLVLDLRLPAPEDLPRLKGVRYVASRDELKEDFLSDAQANAMYDGALYQTALRTIHELFESDYANALDAAAFNGVVYSVDRSTGRQVHACVLSLQVSRENFEALDLRHVDPKACFKALKGVGSSQLHGLAPVAPIVRLDTSDARFVQSYAVADTLDESTNLASMDWEDFEHLVREVFEKEFGSSGGEVRVTRASRDGGVDAIALDPDPIRGGKIVIQAKRYANTVGVSAVRDLYGTVMNEGAIKGILVSTANYGPDAYEFAKGKPLTLLNGGNLLHLLAKHGHKATIDLAAAQLKN